MGIESIDRIVRMPISVMPDACEVTGGCGMIFTVTVQPAMSIGNEIVLWWLTDVQTGVSEAYPGDKEFDVLVPDTLCDPITEAELITALAAKGIEF